MCGIYCALSVDKAPNQSDVPKDLLQRRGPDSCREHTVTFRDSHGQLITLFLLSTVLSLRGSGIVTQPLIDEESGSAFCWNGEAWSIDEAAVTGNDSLAVFSLLLQASQDTSDPTKVATISAFAQAISRIRGPYAFVFYDALNQLLYFGRDCLGRRSLVRSRDTSGNLVLSANESSSDHITRIPYAYTSDKASGSLPTLVSYPLALTLSSLMQLDASFPLSE